MERKYEVKLIFHLKEIKENYFIKIFETKKQIQGEDIIFEFSGNIFDDFQISLPTRVCLLDEANDVLKEFILIYQKEVIIIIFILSIILSPSKVFFTKKTI